MNTVHMSFSPGYCMPVEYMAVLSLRTHIQIMKVLHSHQQCVVSLSSMLLFYSLARLYVAAIQQDAKYDIQCFLLA